MAAKKSAKKKSVARKKGGKKAVQAKLFHKIGEVCDLTDTEPFVLRYWEQEFPFLAPEKTKSGHRIYTDEDIETVKEIKRLLYDEKYTTAGARRWLEKQREDRKNESAGPPSPAPEALVPPEDGSEQASEQAAELGELKGALKGVTSELSALRAELVAAAGKESAAAAGAEQASPRKKAARKKTSKARGGR